jgi:hypothetical protein
LKCLLRGEQQTGQDEKMVMHILTFDTLDNQFEPHLDNNFTEQGSNPGGDEPNCFVLKSASKMSMESNGYRLMDKSDQLLGTPQADLICTFSR